MATVLMAALVTLSVAVPLLDQGRVPGPVAVGTGSDSGYIDHHHGVCLQHGAAGWSPAVGPTLSWSAVEHPAPVDRMDRPLPHLSFVATHHSRAPPRV
jgi:hypothetical protein